MIGVPQNSGTTEYQRNNRITKQHQEILPTQNDDKLSRWHNRIQKTKVILTDLKDFYGRVARQGQRFHVINFRVKFEK